jgi:hypothetical protein
LFKIKIIDKMKLLKVLKMYNFTFKITLLDGWMDGWMDVKAILRIPNSNSKLISLVGGGGLMLKPVQL